MNEEPIRGGCIAGAVLVVAGGLVLAGCGGEVSGPATQTQPSEVSVPGPGTAQAGAVSFTIRWPVQPSGSSPVTAAIPTLSQSIQIRLVRGGTALITDCVTRTTESTISRTYANISAGSLTVEAQAWPNGTCAGTVLATASTSITVLDNQTATAILTLTTTIATVDVTGANFVQMGQSITLTATAKDSNGAVVLVPTNGWSWSTGNPTQATVGSCTTNTCAVTGVAATAAVTITARETEFNKQGSKAIAVTSGTSGGIWSNISVMVALRSEHRATLLPNGNILVAGGWGSGVLASAELYDPASGTWVPTSSLNAARRGPTMTLLPNGKMLVAGGTTSTSAALASAELYDPATGTWTPTSSMNVAREAHTATLLPNGKVLVAGGINSGPGGGGPDVASAELYDPATSTWTFTGSMSRARHRHTATLLPNGKVLVVMGTGCGADLYDPANGTWTSTTSPSTCRSQHTATLLPTGKVLVAGGDFNLVTSAAVDLYDPQTGVWTPTGNLNTARTVHTATLLPNGKVLVAGGEQGSVRFASAELYDTATGTWTFTGSLATVRGNHSATLLPNGRVLVAGGFGGTTGVLASAELYTPVMPGTPGTWTSTGSMSVARLEHTATLLPNGVVLVAGGRDPFNGLASAELYSSTSGTWSATGSMTTTRGFHTATVLVSGPNAGKVLVTGGSVTGSGGGARASAEIYDPASGTWSSTGNMTTARAMHTATVLTSGPNAGKVLMAGGVGFAGILASAELYDPATGVWSSTGSLTTARRLHAATVLTSGPHAGKVLVAGGEGGGNALASAELYDPTTGTWTPTGSLATARRQPTLTLLTFGTHAGKVLIAGGDNFSAQLASAELYDPASGTWTATGNLAAARAVQTATLLPNGQVLVVGGFSSGVLRSAELYDSILGTWSFTGSMAFFRDYHTATLLPNGQVLVSGGPGISSTELFSFSIP